VIPLSNKNFMNFFTTYDNLTGFPLASKSQVSYNDHKDNQKEEVLI